ncbi:MAG: quinone-dependent dihydroorotate dehydrogenase [Opitutaceae bacterium]|nr:quinone-dependent dihydroorotate dehydrogenase [Opitutaceae bacterium]
MGFCYEKLLRPALFSLDAEKAHEIGVKSLGLLSSFPPFVRSLEFFNQLPSNYKPISLFGLEFPNRVGLAAGFDKNGTCWRAVSAIGFGHVEIGTVTFHGQPGNPKPRAFRYPEEEAIINRMGFNNDGAEAMARRLSSQTPKGKRRIPLGISIGKSKITPLDEAVGDYLGTFRLIADYADYVVINVSSPNTPDLRKLQSEELLMNLLSELEKANREKAVKKGKKRVPILVKIAPDLTFPEIQGVLSAIDVLGLDGIIATNTTLARPGSFAAVKEAGGLSGRPVTKKATEIIRFISHETEGRLPIIGVGGIYDSATAAEKMDAGASLIQLYTGMIFRGPFLAREVARGIAIRELSNR